ncbi:MAG: hypothetical protein KJ622_16140 [Alphaproteobacteria bacterium]|nr:hypothetical protein [Alphaproteobacteria bacterium]
MKHADEPDLGDLKKLLKRLEKIDPDTRASASADAAARAAGTARKAKPAILDRPANDAAPADALLQLKSRDGHKIVRDQGARPTEFPVIVKHPVPATIKSGSDSGAFHTVIVASITAAVVSALATAGTVYWLNLDSSRLAFEAPVISSVPASQDSFAARLGASAPPAREAAPPAADAPSKPISPGAAQVAAPGVAEGAASGATPAEAPAVPAVPAAPTEMVSTDQDSSTTSPTQPGQFASGQAESEPAAASRLLAQSGQITPPRPKLVGIPEVSGDIAQSESATELELAATPAAANSSGSQSAQAVRLGPAQPAPEVSSARELVAALSPSQALASEPGTTSEIQPAKAAIAFLGATTVIGPGATGAPAPASPLPESETPSASAQTKAPVVAVFEAPQDLPPTARNAEEPAAADPAASREVPPPVPELGPGEVAIHHAGVVPIAGDEPAPFPLQVLGAPSDLSGHHLIITGLKRGSKFSAGTELTSDTWRVDLADLADLKLTVPTGFAHRINIAAELRRPDGTARKSTEFVLTMPGVASVLVPDAQEAPDLPAAVQRNVDNGEVQIDSGSMSAARILFQRAADAGSARGAMLLAATYDPNYVAVFQTNSPPAPDVAEAIRWYARAAELGATHASERRARLELQ